MEREENRSQSWKKGIFDWSQFLEDQVPPVIKLFIFSYQDNYTVLPPKYPSSEGDLAPEESLPPTRLCDEIEELEQIFFDTNLVV